jgi:hypothetical protein
MVTVHGVQRFRVQGYFSLPRIAFWRSVWHDPPSVGMFNHNIDLVIDQKSQTDAFSLMIDAVVGRVARNLKPETRNL